jgi:predicted  nucleic acid-binding Zn-ribbon protein
MIEEPENLVLVMLRRLDSKFDRMTEEMREMKGRLTNVEIVISALVTADGRMQHSIDRMSDRLDRIERRLDITTDAPPL